MTARSLSAVAVCLLVSSAGLALAQPATTGAALFENRCVMCHSGDPFSQGPPLADVVGRRAGAVAGFAYSPAMKRSGLTWTRGALDQFLADPGKTIPGTAMPIRVVDPAQRSAIISYLASRR
ncbi:MAG: c-type cytochrome [Caulobacteraceae bacterium]